MAVHYEDIIKKINGFGIYQKRVLIFVAITQITNAFTSLIPNFILGEHRHKCKVPGFSNQTFDDDDATYNLTKCTYSLNSTTYSCNSWVYDQSVYTDTFISSFNLVCDRKFYRSHLVMAHHLGSFSGMIIMSCFADIFGRKLMICLANTFLFAANITQPWAHNFFLITFLRYLNGLSGTVTYVSGFILVTEMVQPSKRMTVGFSVSMGYMVGEYILDLIAYFARDWHELILYTSAPIGINLLSWFFIPESPRWFIVKKKFSKAVDMLNKMADVNGAKVQFDINSIACCIEERHQISFLKSVKSVITSKQLFIRTLILSFNWFAVTLMYYGITMNVGKLGGDVYVNMAISTSVGMLGEIIALLASYKIGRKRLCISYMIIGGIGCLLTILPSLYGQKWVIA
ncbi:solute carrier family 22 member 3-like isoform X2 [Mytilus galloprovincialis]|uniref:solute carrier family 22 member 3-like isoform X2 n=1 Tax=Mytilus galloprovincialis TaxID=29158 RepID=UPI003F7BE482